MLGSKKTNVICELISHLRISKSTVWHLAIFFPDISFVSYYIFILVESESFYLTVTIGEQKSARSRKCLYVCTDMAALATSSALSRLMFDNGFMSDTVLCMFYIV